MNTAIIRYRIPGLGTASRLIIFGVASIGGILLQIFWREAGMYLGTALLVVPLTLLSAKSWSNKPKDIGEEDWQPVTDAELDRIADAFKSTRNIKLPLWYRPGFGIPFTIALAVIAVLLGSALTLPGLLATDALILLWPALNFLKIRLWIPREFEMVINALYAARSIALPEGILCTPYLRLDRDEQGLRIPESARLMLEPRRKPDDLLGIQMQVAINKGPNGQVPYLYAVVLTHGQGATWRKASGFRANGYSVEPGGDENYGTVVIRQRTEGGGYCTKPDDCRQLMSLMVELLARL
jgi:hypothetical protein